MKKLITLILLVVMAVQTIPPACLFEDTVITATAEEDVKSHKFEIKKAAKEFFCSAFTYTSYIHKADQISTDTTEKLQTVSLTAVAPPPDFVC